MKRAYVKVIFGLYPGRNIIIPETKDGDNGERGWKKILVFTQRAKNVINIPLNQMTENSCKRITHQCSVTTIIKSKVQSRTLH